MGELRRIGVFHSFRAYSSLVAIALLPAAELDRCRFPVKDSSNGDSAARKSVAVTWYR